jgi:hypothetical protein
LPYLPHTLWECALGNGQLKALLEDAGHSVVGTSADFLTHEPLDVDAIVTNPPYSLKTQFLKRAYELDIPFAFLLPITALEGKERQALYVKHGVQVLFLDKRIDFTGKGAPWFAVAWFTHGLDLPRDMTFQIETRFVDE